MCTIPFSQESTLKKIDIMRNIDKMPSVSCPVCIMHGTDDGVVPCAHGRRLHEIAQRCAHVAHANQRDAVG